MSDRLGRKGALLTGLAIFRLGSIAGAQGNSTGQLIAARGVMGVGAAVVFPTTLSILSNVFTSRVERARAIGAWGATVGMGVAFGPIVSDYLLEHFWWGSVRVAMAPVAATAILLVGRFVPTSRDPATPRLDRLGLTLPTAMIGRLVHTIIEAPTRGWAAPATLFQDVDTLALNLRLTDEQRLENGVGDPHLHALLTSGPASSERGRVAAQGGAGPTAVLGHQPEERPGTEGTRGQGRHPPGLTRAATGSRGPSHRPRRRAGGRSRGREGRSNGPRPPGLVELGPPHRFVEHKYCVAEKRGVTRSSQPPWSEHFGLRGQAVPELVGRDVADAGLAGARGHDALDRALLDRRVVVGDQPVLSMDVLGSGPLWDRSVRKSPNVSTAASTGIRVVIPLAPHSRLDGYC